MHSGAVWGEVPVILSVRGIWRVNDLAHCVGRLVQRKEDGVSVVPVLAAVV